jgi:excisionase family DNA binding protein
MEELLTIEQAARRLKLSEQTVRIQCRTGFLRAVKRGRQWRVPESALLEDAPEPNAQRDQTGPGAR